MGAEKGPEVHDATVKYGGSDEHLEYVDEAKVQSGGDAVATGYWGSWRFIGTIIAIILLGNSLFIGYVMPVRRRNLR